ncbi:hypothetical protein [Bradyrhizobium japonicum]|uniref:hypothetical protein n=1 Tax=Bradyrhizobium japonicum TaxID=375 RepID=UPI0004627191|nr:hypothetical protein [Bradyrhizobium japonicum]
MSEGTKNIVVGLMMLAGFMVYGFVLIYLRDFAPGKEKWIADYAVGKHFESRLAHVHGNLFALINVAIGLVLARFPLPKATGRSISWLGIAGLLMPLGILSEVFFSVPPLLVLAGGVAMVVCMAWLAVAVRRNIAAQGA